MEDVIWKLTKRDLESIWGALDLYRSDLEKKAQNTPYPKLIMERVNKLMEQAEELYNSMG